MNWRIKILTGLLCATVTGTAWAGWNDYTPATLSDITSKHTSHFSNRKVPRDTVAINLHPGGDPFRSTILFLGKVRNMKPDRRSLIEMWGKSSGMDTAMLAKTYKKEIQVRENGEKDSGSCGSGGVRLRPGFQHFPEGFGLRLELLDPVLEGFQLLCPGAGITDPGHRSAGRQAEPRVELVAGGVPEGRQ